jgi:hypothetical protein
MLTFSVIVAVVVLGLYSIRRNIRRAWHVLRTGNEKPDWDALYQKWYGERWKEFAHQDDRRWWNGF